MAVRISALLANRHWMLGPPAKSAVIWSTATISFGFAPAITSTLALRSRLTGNNICRLATGLGMSASASELATMPFRLMAVSPRLSASALRMASSVVKPSVSRASPKGLPELFCSIKAMRNWSWVMRPSWMSLSPKRTGGAPAGAATTPEEWGVMALPPATNLKTGVAGRLVPAPH